MRIDCDGGEDPEADRNADAYYDDQRERADLLRRTPIEAEAEGALRKESEEHE
jgi:hypothetical protein